MKPKVAIRGLEIQDAWISGGNFDKGQPSYMVNSVAVLALLTLAMVICLLNKNQIGRVQQSVAVWGSRLPKG